MKRWVLTLVCFAAVLFTCTPAFCAENLEVYPLRALFVSDKARTNELFARAISSDDKGGDRGYATSRFLKVFTDNFPNSAKTINAQNRYSTFAAYLQIPRVSMYQVVKSQTLVDLYLPMTMTISFANMGTGEILYTYTYTYYSKREATFASLSDDSVTVGLYRDTFNQLLEKVVSEAKQNFRPFSVSATINRNWQGLSVLDRGTADGLSKGDNLAGPQGMPLSVLYAGDHYAVAQPIMGEPKPGMPFNKLSNGNLDEMKKPKVMLMPGTAVAHTGIPEQMVYQLFINALGKNAAFSLISVDKSFYDVQQVVTQETGLPQAVTQQRELPDFFLRLSFAGPVSATVSSNKNDVKYDEHHARACGDFLDRSGRVLYGRCVEESISDQIVNGIRFSREDREEIVVKNALIKLADDFVTAVRFKRFELELKPKEGDRAEVADKAGILSVGGNEQVFKNLGRLGGIEGEVLVPTWQVSVAARSGGQVELTLLGGMTPEVPKPAQGDQVIVEGMVTGAKDALKRFSLCEATQPEPIEGLAKQVYYSIVRDLGYPLYDSATFNRALATINGAGYGFKKSGDERPLAKSEIGYCVEPVTKVIREKSEQKEGYSSHSYKLVAGLKVHERENVVWKKGLQQAVSITCPDGAGQEYVDYEVSKAICGLISGISTQVEVPRK